MARIAAVKEQLEKTLKDESKPWVKLLIQAEGKTGIDRLYIFVGKLLHNYVDFAPIDWSALTRI